MSKFYAERLRKGTDRILLLKVINRAIYVPRDGAACPSLRWRMCKFLVRPILSRTFVILLEVASSSLLIVIKKKHQHCVAIAFPLTSPWFTSSLAIPSSHFKRWFIIWGRVPGIPGHVKGRLKMLSTVEWSVSRLTFNGGNAFEG